ncbi:MAG TPA: pilus assembly PilX N-terminal domain-containing protein [Candidatus Saccharimonadales bacterium]|jgi:Tfp pilus assembly protein PilX
MYNRYLKPIVKSQAGYASFVITLVTIIVVSLIVVAFSTDARLEQKNSLANNEATQAYYAAESGINDAYAVIVSDIRHNASPPTYTSCAPANSAYINSSNSNELNSTNTEYTCLIVNPAPTAINIQGVQSGQGEVIPLYNPSTAINHITVSWEEDTTGALTFSGCTSSSGTFMPSGSYTGCSAGVLQLDILSGTSLNNDINSNNGFNSQPTTIFLQPTHNSGAAALETVGNPTEDNVYPVECGSSPGSGYPGQYDCTATINVPSNNTYYLHLQSFYDQSTNISVTAQSTAPTGSNNLAISNDQVVIDSTGEADGQLKRIQENVCDNVYCNNASFAPATALGSSQCIIKNFDVYPGDASNEPDNSGC